MPPRKGMSLAEKRDALLEVFHESADVFVLKDIEKLGTKKGIVTQTVKEVLQSLVDDNLVRQEKIGISNYFWSFPGEASAKLQSEGDKLLAEKAALERRVADAQQAVQAEKRGKELTEEHAQGMQALEDLRVRVGRLQAELERSKADDPQVLRAMKDGTQTAHDAANRWLDNIYVLMTWCKQTFPGQEEALSGFFKEQGYKETLDYI